jgi:hypothetical protein
LVAKTPLDIRLPKKGTDMSKRERRIINEVRKTTISGIAISTIFIVLLKIYFPDAKIWELSILAICGFSAYSYMCISYAVDRIRSSFGDLIEKHAMQIEDKVARRATISMGRALSYAEDNYYDILFAEIYDVSNALDEAINMLVDSKIDNFEYMDYLKYINPYVSALRNGSEIQFEKRTA